MKALIISDKQEIIDTVKYFLSEKNYDIIIYRWLLKALDNIEEIQPDLIILSSSEYPRHWKTLASFVQSGIGGNAVRLFLYEPEPLNEDDKNKAEKLGIEGFLDSLSSDQLEKLVQGYSIAEAVNRPAALKYELILTDPCTGKFVFGNALSYENSDEFSCTLAAENNLKINQYVKYVSIFDSENVKAFSAQIIEINKSDIKIKIKESYEEI